MDGIDRAPIDNYIIETIYQKNEISRQAFLIFKNMLSQYRREHNNPKFLRGWEKFAESLVKETPVFVSKIKYPEYSSSLNERLNPYVDLDTLALAKKLQNLKDTVLIPTHEQVSTSPEIFAKFQQDLEVFQKLLFAYHYRPNPIIPAKKPFTPSRPQEEEIFESWLLAAQKQLLALQEAAKKSQSSDKLVRDIQSHERDIEAVLNQLKRKSDIFAEDIESFQIKIDALQKLYESYKNKYGTDYAGAAIFLSGIKKQFAVIKIREVEKPQKQEQPQQKISPKDLLLSEKLHQLVEKFHEFRTATQIKPFYFSELKKQLGQLNNDMQTSEISQHVKDSIMHEKESIEKWITQAEPLFALQNQVQKNLEMIQKRSTLTESEVQSFVKLITDYEEKLIAYKNEYKNAFAGSEALLSQLNTFAREKSLQLLKKLKPAEQQKEEKKIQEIDKSAPAASFEEILKKRIGQFEHLVEEVEEESGDDWV